MTAQNTNTIQNENTSSAIHEEYEGGAGHQMWLMGEARKQLEGDDRLAEAAGELRAALGALDDAYMAVESEAMLHGTTDEDAAAQALVADELAAINRRLDMLLALAAVRDAARGLGRLVVKPEAAEDESDDVEH